MLGSKQLILTSPQDIDPIVLGFHTGSGISCLMSTYDSEKGLAWELSAESWWLYQRPVRELVQYRRDLVVDHQILVSVETDLPGVQGRCWT